MQNKDAFYLDRLRDYYAENGILPSFSRIASLIGLRSTSAVAAMVSRLKEQGYLSSGESKRIQPGPLFHARQLADFMLPAGMPQDTQDSGTEPLVIDRYLIDEPSRTVLAPVTGNSMIDAGLMPGDIVVIKRGAITQPGDVVVAKIDGEFTVKYLDKDNSGYFLRPANPSYPVIRPHDELEIFGRVTGSFRKYN